jgi:limonene-1,2-epoxide hydrolase
MAVFSNPNFPVSANPLSSAIEYFMANSAALPTALRAWKYLAAGHYDGDFQQYLEMLTEDYTFSMPLGEFQGTNVGRDRAIQCYQAITQAQPRMVFLEPSLISVHDNTVTIEWEDEGTLMGMSYRNRIVGIFEVRGEYICSYREYFGNIDLKMLNAIASAY